MYVVRCYSFTAVVKHILYNMVAFCKFQVEFVVYMAAPRCSCVYSWPSRLTAARGRRWVIRGEDGGRRQHRGRFFSVLNSSFLRCSVFAAPFPSIAVARRLFPPLRPRQQSPRRWHAQAKRTFRHSAHLDYRSEL